MRDFNVRGIEPSAEMRKLARERVPGDLVSDGSVTDLPVGDQSQDFIYAIEVFRYLDAADNALGHREIFRALKPGGVFFGTYVNKMGLGRLSPICSHAEIARHGAQDGAALSRRVRNRLVASGESLQPPVSKNIEIRGAMFAPAAGDAQTLAEARHSHLEMDAAARELAVGRGGLALAVGSSHRDRAAGRLRGTWTPLAPALI